MPAERTTMRQLREIVRLHEVGVSTRQIGIRVGVAASTVRLTLRRMDGAGLSAGIAPEQTDAALEALLFSGAGKKLGHRRHTDPDWAAVHRELKRRHVTLTILWDEYIARHPDGYRYSRFCELYRGWEGRLSVKMRQTHHAGEKLFVDYAGDTIPVVIDRLTGAASTDLRGRAGCLELPVYGGELDAGAGGLDRVSQSRLCRDRRRAGAGQHQGRSDQGLPVRRSSM